MLENISLHKRNSIYIAVVVGAFWMLASFFSTPQILVLYLLERMSESFNVEAATTKNVFYLVGVVIFATLFNISRSRMGMVLSAIGVTFFLTPPFTYYDNFIPQEPYFMPAFLCGFCVIMILSFSGFLKKDL